MRQARGAAGVDRLPWLADEPTPPQRRGANREAAGWAVVATLLVAGVSYWMGVHSLPQQPQSWRRSIRPETTASVPQTPVAEPQPEVTFEPAPQVTPVPEQEVPIAMPRAEKRVVARRPGVPARHATPAPPPRSAPAARPVLNAAEKPLAVWPAFRSKGAAGRIVRIGAYGSRAQAKFGWRYMVREYPAVAHLPATVVETRNSRGRPFYRFQIGTTSQAHSEVLCQRMEKIRLSCAVVGLPWRPTGVER